MFIYAYFLVMCATEIAFIVLWTAWILSCMRQLLKRSPRTTIERPATPILWELQTLLTQRLAERRSHPTKQSTR